MKVKMRKRIVSILAAVMCAVYFAAGTISIANASNIVNGGTAILTGGKNVKGNPGDTVKVPIYLDVPVDAITYLKIEMEFNTSALVFEDFEAFEADKVRIYGNFGMNSNAMYIQNPPDDKIHVDSTEPLIELVFKINENAAPGEYKIDFEGEVMNAVEITIIEFDCKTNPGSIIVGNKEVPTEPTAPTPTTAVTTTKQGGIPDDKTAVLKGERNVKGNPGDTVKVPIYLDVPVDAITYLRIDMEFDNSALEFNDFEYEDRERKLHSYGISSATNAMYIQNPPNYKIPVDSTEPLLELVFKIKEDAAPGEYEIGFEGEVIDAVDITIIEFDCKTSPGSIIVEDKAVTTTTKTTNTGTTTQTTTKTTAVTTQVSDGIDKVYDGRAIIRAERDVKGSAGDIVEVPVYLEPDYDDGIIGIAFGVDYDTTAFDLVGMEPGHGIGGAATYNPDSGAFAMSSANDPFPVDKTEPVVVYKFKIKENAKNGEYKIDLAGPNGSPMPIILRKYDYYSGASIGSATRIEIYYDPVVYLGSVIVESRVTGDLNGDGKIEVSDLVALQKMLLGGEMIDLRIADINKDGEFNVFDIVSLRRILLK